MVSLCAIKRPVLNLVIDGPTSGKVIPTCHLASRYVFLTDLSDAYSRATALSKILHRPAISSLVGLITMPGSSTQTRSFIRLSRGAITVCPTAFSGRSFLPGRRSKDCLLGHGLYLGGRRTTGVFMPIERHFLLLDSDYERSIGGAASVGVGHVLRYGRRIAAKDGCRRGLMDCVFNSPANYYGQMLVLPASRRGCLRPDAVLAVPCLIPTVTVVCVRKRPAGHTAAFVRLCIANGLLAHASLGGRSDF